MYVVSGYDIADVRQTTFKNISGILFFSFAKNMGCNMQSTSRRSRLVYSNCKLSMAPENETDVALGGGCIILIDVPPGTSITLDGITRITPSSALSTANAQSAPFHPDLLIISHVAGSPEIDDFHFLVVRPFSASGDCRSLPVGFVIGCSQTTTKTAADLGYGWIFARRYDPHTEEMSNEAVDGLTVKNIILAMRRGTTDSQAIITYGCFIGSASNNESMTGTGENHAPSGWEDRTSMINAQYLKRRHQIVYDNKIVPSSESINQTVSANNESAVTNNNLKSDGTSISYPPIPCIDQTINPRQLAQHRGTRIYLSKITPGKRTWLLFGGDSDTEPMSPGEFIWNDTISRHYGGNGISSNNSERDFLADIQLSFILFLYLECHSSLEHWRDAISMCSLSTTDTTSNIVVQHPEFFNKMLSILYYQLSCIEKDFFSDSEYSSGENNFLVGALRKLCEACERVGKRKRHEGDEPEQLKALPQKLRQLIRERFGLDLLQRRSNDDNDMDVDAYAQLIGEEDADETIKKLCYNHEENEEDGPIVVAYSEIEASVQRSRRTKKVQTPKHCDEQISAGTMKQRHNNQYRLLYASMSPGEDEVMACARILDEKNDVSLVREAAAYLEEVEAHRGGSF